MSFNSDQPIGPCPHGVIDEICEHCTADNLWRLVVEHAPSKHLQGELAERAFGYRLGLAKAAMRLQPLRYLEVGVRLGHSLGLVTLAAEVLGGDLEYATAIDAWIADYAGEPNPGAAQVYELLEEIGPQHERVVMMSGDSHELLPALQGGPRYNLILIDGDHTDSGAAQDLEDAFELLEPGGELVFDDAVYEGDNRLLRVWRQFVTLSAARPLIASAGEELEDEPAWCWLKRGGE